MTVEPAPGKPRSAVSGARLAVVLVTVMLLLAGIAFLFDRSVGPFGDRGDDDELDISPAPGSVVFITQDTRWTGMTGDFSTFAEVWAGRTLTVEDCDLTVALEDLIIADRPLFTVNDSGTLLLVNTGIRVTFDPNATRAVYHSAVNLNRWETAVPILSRVVNLLHTTSPVLSLNVSWRACRTDLVVVGQRSPIDPMQVLARLGGGGEGWEHVEVDLSYLAGAVARVAVFPLDNEYDVVLISDAMVLDGGAVPPGERFGAASLREDGWDLSNFHTLLEFGEGYLSPLLGPLIESYGTLVLDNSTIEGPAGLPRWTESDEFYPSDPSELIARGMYLTSTIGLHVQAYRGTVQVRSTELLNVPLRADRTELLIQDSRLAGEADALTCRRCTGTVSRCDIVRAPSPDLRGYDLDEKTWTWAVSVEEDDPTRHLALEDVRVQGGDLGMYIGGRGPIIDGCSFSGSSVLCLWSDGPSETPTHGSWPQLNATCSFGPSKGHRYFETRMCEVEFVWSDGILGHPSVGFAYVSTEYWQDLPIDQDNRDRYGGSIVTLRLPSVSVGPTGDVRTFENVTVVVEPEEGSAFEHGIAPGTTHEVVEVKLWQGTPDEVRKRLEDYELAYPHVIPSGEAGEALLDVITSPDVLYSYLDVENVIVRARLNGTVYLNSYLYKGVLVDDYRTPPTPWGIHFYVPVTLGPGLNELDIEVLGLWDDTMRHELVWNRTFALLRANSSTAVDVIREVLANGGTLMLDPGEDLDLGWPLPSVLLDDLNYAPVNCTLWNGSHLTVTGVEGEGLWTYVSGFFEGPGNVTLLDMDVTYLELRVVNTTLRVEDLTSGGISAQLYDSHLEVRRSHLIWSVGIASWTCSTVLIEECTIAGEEQGSTVLDVFGYEAYGLNMTNTTLVATAPMLARFSSYYGADILLDGCTFTNVTVHVRPRAVYGGGDVSVWSYNCTFEGDCAYVTVLDTSNVYSTLNNVMLWLGGTTFEGAGTGVATQDGTYTILEDLALEDGAMVLTFRPIDVDITSPPPRYYMTLVEDPYMPTFMDLPPFRSDFLSPLYEDHLLTFDIQAGDPPSGALTSHVTLMVDKDDEVVWFEEVALDGRSIYVDVPTWKRIDDVVSHLRSDILSGVDWWT